MMNNKMMLELQKAQKELEKKRNALLEKEFTVSKGGAVTIAMTGNYEVVEIVIEKDVLEPDNKDMLEELILLAYTELFNMIKQEETAIDDELKHKFKGLPL
ncbi:MAG: YbaB/EbfC family nucleoid-associated protein [Erysipelotrichaceae bacterium]|nr:YbaB/EbfC family nucleoid-associated protein [Erysipelotrichaceae bacterium]